MYLLLSKLGKVEKMETQQACGGGVYGACLSLMGVAVG